MGLTLFCLRAMHPDCIWKDGLIRFGFWSINIGLLATVTLRWMRAFGDTIFAAGSVALVLFIVGLSQGSSSQQAPPPVVKTTKPTQQVA